MSLQGRVLQHKRLGLLAGQFQQVGIVGEAGQGQIRQTRLLRAQHLAGAPQAQVHFSNLEAIGAADEHLQALASLGVVAPMQEQAVGCRRTPSHPAPQLVQLGQAKTFGMLDHHHARLRHIHPYLHHRGADQHLALTAGKGADRRLLGFARKAAVQQTNLQIDEHLLGQVSVLLHRRAEIELFAVLHQRQHHIGPLAQGHLLAHQLPGLLPLAGSEQSGADRCAAGGELIDLAHIKIAMHREGQGAGDRGGGHGEQVGLEPLGQQAVALAHAKAVLLIHHHQAQPGELHRILEQGMGTHQDLELTVDQILQQFPPPSGRGGAGEQGTAHMQLGQPVGELGEMLLRQHLSGSHQGALAAGLNRTEQGGEGHHGLAAAHISLEQPCHRLGPGQVMADLGEHAILGAGEGKRQDRAQLSHQIGSTGRGIQGGGGTLTELVAALGQTQLKQEELVKDQAPPAGLQIRLVGGLVDAPQGLLTGQ